jgi:diacylglycerol kinase
MSTRLRPFQPPEELDGGERRRPPWRQRLVEVERGITQGVRGDSTFFVHFFLGSVVIATGFVLGIAALQWAVIVMALTMVLSAEMFNQVLKAIVHSVGHQLAQPLVKAMRIATAAVFVTMLGTLVAILIVFAERLATIFSGA